MRAWGSVLRRAGAARAAWRRRRPQWGLGRGLAGGVICASAVAAVAQVDEEPSLSRARPSMTELCLDFFDQLEHGDSKQLVAPQFQSVDTARFLHCRDINGTSSVMKAAVLDRDDVLDAWFQQYGVKGGLGRAPERYAPASQATAIDLSKSDSFGMTAVAFAAWTGSAHSLKVLLDAGASPFCLDLYGQSALHRAVQAGSLECTRLLMQAGVSPETFSLRVGQPFEWGDIQEVHESPLHRAAYDGKLEILEALVYGDFATRLGAAPADGATAENPQQERKRCGNVNVANTEGMTPLHHACVSREESAVQWLLDNGANPMARDVMGHVPADYCRYELGQIFDWGALYRIRNALHSAEQRQEFERRRAQAQ